MIHPSSDWRPSNSLHRGRRAERETKRCQNTAPPECTHRCRKEPATRYCPKPGSMGGRARAAAAMVCARPHTHARSYRVGWRRRHRENATGSASSRSLRDECLRLAWRSAYGGGAVRLYCGRACQRNPLPARLHPRTSQANLGRSGNVHPICTVEHPEIDPIMAGLVKSTGKVEPTKTFGWLSEMAMDTKSKLICIEAASDVFDVDEIVRCHAKACVRLLQGLAIKADAAVLLLFHPSLSGITSGRGTSGSTQWNNTMRSRLFFQTLPGTKDDDTTSRRKVLR